MNLLKYKKLEMVILVMGIISATCLSRSWDVRAASYTSGLVTVGHREVSVKRDGRRIQFKHPCELNGNVITNLLSYIYFEEKGLLKKKETLRVFQDDEIRNLVPLIVQAFSAATPAQVVAVSSFSERMLLTDQQNYCIMFVGEYGLNIVFSRIHKFQTYNDAMSDKKRYTFAAENPAAISHSRFWRLIPSAGQQLEPDHENWLVIDLSQEMYQQPVAQRVGTVDEKIRVGTSDLDTRLKKLEEKMSGMDAHRQPEAETTERIPLTVPPGEIADENKIKGKLAILRELVDEGVISEEDYNYKKEKMLKEILTGMSIKEQLWQIKDLKSEGLITEEEYNVKKKELLDQF